MSREVVLNGRVIGSGQACFIIAEVGVNHDGRPELAHRLIDVAAAAGCDAVKFQIFDAASVVSRSADPAPYQAQRLQTPTQFEMLENLTMPPAAWPEIASHVAERGLVFLATAFDLTSAQLVEDLGAPAFKVPSGELDNMPFLRSLASRRLPLLISTGMATEAEVRAALDATVEAPGVALFHCVTAYPTPIEASNLLAIRTLANTFDVPVGWSDHTEGALTAIAARAIGAAMLEKHITLDRTQPGPDHAASSSPDEIHYYVRCVRETEAALGDGVKKPDQVELENVSHARRSWHAATDLAAGTVIAISDVVLLRPAVGVPASVAIEGAVLRRDIKAGRAIREADLV